MRSGKWSPGPGPVSLDGELPLVVPVMSAAGGAGRSTLAALLAAGLHQRTSHGSGRAVGVCDIRPRAASPWPGWLDHTAERGTSWLAECTADPRRFAQQMRRSTSAIDGADGRPIWVMTDTGPLGLRYAGADPGPAFWAPALRYLRAAVIDADSLEGFRLARQAAGGEPASAAAWMATPLARTVGLWVTDPSPAGMSATLAAITTAQECDLPMERLVVAVNDPRGDGWAARSLSRRLLADRVGAIVEIAHDVELRRDDRPSASPAALARRDLVALVSAVIAAAGPRVVRQAAASRQVVRRLAQAHP